MLTEGERERWEGIMLKGRWGRRTVGGGRRRMRGYNVEGKVKEKDGRV